MDVGGAHEVVMNRGCRLLVRLLLMAVVDKQAGRAD